MPLQKWGAVVLLSLLLTSFLTGQKKLEEPVILSVENLPIGEALLHVGEAADIDLIFSPQFFDADQIVSLPAGEMKISEALENCLEGTGIGYTYQDGQVVLVRKQFSVIGYLVDAASGERLIGGHIRVEGGTQGTYSNSYGFFSLTLPAGKHRLICSYLGYQPLTFPVSLLSDRKVEINLEASLTLEEVVVSASTPILQVAKSEEVPLRILNNMPTALGEPDLFRKLDFLPGVQTGTDGFSGISVRGGNTDQNLVLLDDVPIFHPTHSLGVLSIFNPELIRNVRFYKDAIPARYGGRLSSVLDVRSREGNNRQFRGQLGMGTLASQLILEGPLKKGRGAWLVAGRRTHIDPLVNWWGERQKEEEDQLGSRSYAFYDLNVKSYYHLSEKDKVFLSFYNGGDRFMDNAEEEALSSDSDAELAGFSQFNNSQYGYQWGNRIGSLRWNHLFSDRLFSNLTLISSRFSYANESSYQTEVTYRGFPVLAYQQNTLFQSDIRNQSVRMDFDFFGDKHQWQWGGHLSSLTYTPGLWSFEEEEERLDSLVVIDQFADLDTVRLQTLEGGGYIEDQFSLGDLDVQIGLHCSMLQSDDTLFWGWQPRLNLTYHLAPSWNVSVSAMRTVQFLHLLTTLSAGLPNDLWVPATRDMPPQRAWQISAGVQGTFSNGWRTELSAYGKRMEGLPFFQSDLLGEEGALEINAGNWEDIAFSADGEAYGLEMLVSRLTGKVRPWVSYTLAETRRFTAQQPLPFALNHRHRLVTALDVQWSPKWRSSISWQYASRAPFTPVLSEGQELSFFQLLPGTLLEEGAFRLPDFHRLDVQVSYEWGEKMWKHNLSMGVTNIYNRQNGLFLIRRNVFSPGQAFELQQINGLPVMPTIRYQLTFENRSK